VLGACAASCPRGRQLSADVALGSRRDPQPSRGQKRRRLPFRLEIRAVGENLLAYAWLAACCEGIDHGKARCGGQNVVGEAISVLNERMPGAEESIELRLLGSKAYAANGDYGNAMAPCDAALKKEPKNFGVQISMA
jgi:hypothetical protein